MYRFGWFSTGRDRAAGDLLTAARDGILRGEIDGEVAFVFCSREPGEAAESDRFIKLVEEYRIPLVCFSYRKFRERAKQPDPDPSAPMPRWRAPVHSTLRWTR